MIFHAIGKINKQMVREFADFCDQNFIERTACINICSQGGDAYCARAIVGLVGALKLRGISVLTRGFGDIHSAAVLIFAVGDKRQLSKYASVMIHNDSGAVEGTTKEIVAYGLQMEADDLAWCKAMKDLTGTNLDTWIDLHDDDDCYMAPGECLRLNLATEVI